MNGTLTTTQPRITFFVQKVHVDVDNLNLNNLGCANFMTQFHQ